MGEKVSIAPTELGRELRYGGVTFEVWEPVKGALSLGIGESEWNYPLEGGLAKVRYMGLFLGDEPIVLSEQCEFGDGRVEHRVRLVVVGDDGRLRYAYENGKGLRVAAVGPLPRVGERVTSVEAPLLPRVGELDQKVSARQCFEAMERMMELYDPGLELLSRLIEGGNLA